MPEGGGGRPTPGLRGKYWRLAGTRGLQSGAAQINISIGCPAPVKAAIHPPYSFTGSWLESTQVHNNKKYKDHLVPSACVALELRPGPYLRADAAQAEVSFRNFGFSPIYQDAPIPQRDAPHKIAAAQIFFDQTGSVNIS